MLADVSFTKSHEMMAPISRMLSLLSSAAQSRACGVGVDLWANSVHLAHAGAHTSWQAYVALRRSPCVKSLCDEWDAGEACAHGSGQQGQATEQPASALRSPYMFVGRDVGSLPYSERRRERHSACTDRCCRAPVSRLVRLLAEGIV